MKKLFVSFLLLTSALSIASAQFSITSQLVGDVAPDQVTSVCTDLTYNLTYKKSKDSNTNGQVSDLQNFLQDQELLSSDPTGYYGALTFQAVKTFQTRSGLLASGYVGPLTRAKIKEVSCSGGSLPVQVSPLPRSSTTTPSEFCDPITAACAAVNPGLNPQLSCAITSDKSSYVLGDKITFTYSSRNATYATWQKDTSGKDNLYVPGDKLLANGIYTVTANMIGLPSVTLTAYNSTGSVTCTKAVPVMATSSEITNLGDVTGDYSAYRNDIFIESYSGISQAGALSACKKYISPTIRLKCVWDNKTIYESYPLPDYEMSSTLKSYLSPSGQNMSPSGKLTITWYSTNPKTGAKASLWLKNLSTGTLKLIASGQDATGSYVWTLPAKGATVVCPDCSGIQAELTAGSYSIVVKTYTPSNAWLGNGFPPANPTLPVYVTTSETSPFTYTKTTAEPKVANYRGYMNGSLFIATNDISRDEALNNCMLNANSNPRSTVKCIWNDIEIYATPTAGTTSTTTLSAARTAGFVTSSVSPNTTGVKIGSFTVQGPTSGQAILKNFYVTLSSTYPLSNITNLSLKVGGSGIGIPIGNPKTDGNLFSASDIAIPSGSARTIDIYADIGAIPGSVTANLSAHGTSPQGVYVVGVTSGVPITSIAATLANPTLVSSSPVPQFVIGGSTFAIATYKLATGAAGAQATVRELRFRINNDSVQEITVGGVSVGVGGNGLVTIMGLNIPISSTGTDVPVVVRFNGFQNSTTGGSLQTGITDAGIALSYVEASASGSVITNTTVVPSPTMSLVASKPTVTMSTEKGKALVLGSENKIGEFTVSADANGKIGLSYASLTVSAMGISNFKLSSPRLSEAGWVSTIPGLQASISGNTVALSFGSYEIAAGQSKTFSVYAVVNGQVVYTPPYLASNLTPSSAFVWRDVVGGNLQQTGEKITNFPTNSWNTLQGIPTVADDVFGQLTVYKNDVVVESSNSSETTALAACKKYVSPTIHLKCTWGDKVLYESFPLPDYGFNPTPVTPTPIPTPAILNKFSPKCSVPGYTGLAAGTEVCYGIWDYGDALGGDVDMCGGYSAANTGCVVSAPACASGKAEAVKYYSAPGMSQAVLQYAANNLNVTPTFLQQNMVMLWVYNCKGDTSALNMSTVSGQVLGASTMCVDLPFDFHRGNQSPSTKKLQDFLIKKGYMEGEVTGFYGDSTVSAVKDYQKGKGLPQTGMVYEFTRNAMKAETCK